MLRRVSSRLMTYAAKTGRPGGILFTPGPLCTSATVKEAMLKDYGSRDSIFVSAVREIREELLKVGRAPASEWTAIPMQGSGTMGIEAVINTTTRKPALGQGAAKYLVVVNGAYSRRMCAIIEKLQVPLIKHETTEGEEIGLAALEKLMQENPDVTNVGVVFCETSTGMMNPVEEIARITRRTLPQATIFVDAMSCFGGFDATVPNFCDVMVSSANKCIEGVPGFSFAIARRSLLEQCRGISTSFTLDLVPQWESLEKGGQFPFTPPVHALMAFRQALREFETEGGVVKRAARYHAICSRIVDGMTKLGFKLFLDPAKPSFGHIITAFHMPTSSPGWNFTRFYKELQIEGFVIYPGKAAEAETFRIGSIGQITLDDADALLEAVARVLQKMNVKL